MPIKPVLTYTFATNANFSLGPFSGTPTKVIPADLANGFVAGDGVPATWFNYVIGATGDWITNWIDLGTSAADLDAHIIETDATGQASLGSLDCGGTTSTDRPLNVMENSGAALSSATFVHSTGMAINADSASSSSGTIFAENSGTGPCMRGLADGTDNDAFEGLGAGAGRGGFFTGGASGEGVVAVGGGASVGVQGTGGGTGGVGVLGIAAHDNFGGLEGQTTATSSVTANAVRGLVLGGSGAGVKGDTSAGDGYAVLALADLSSPVSAAFRMAPQDDDPSVGAEGDLMYNSTTDEFRGYQDGRWQALVAEENGYTRAVTSLQSSTNNSAAAYTQLVSATLSSPYDPKHTGTVMIQAVAEFGADGANIHTTIDIRIRDTTSGATVWLQTIDHPAAVAGPIFDRPWSIMVPYTLPATGSRNFHLEFKKTGGAGTGIGARDASLYIHGVY